MNMEHEGADSNELMLVRRQKLDELRQDNIEPFGGKYQRTHHSTQIIEGFEGLEGQQVSLAGRLMAKRGHGKAGFANLQDGEGNIQLYVRLPAIALNIAPERCVNIGSCPRYCDR